MDDLNQLSVEDAVLTVEEAKQFLKTLNGQVSRVQYILDQALKKEAEAKKVKKTIKDKSMTTCVPQFIFDIFEKEVMPLLKEKTHCRRKKFDASNALRYMVYHAVRYPQDIRGVELEELKKFFNIE